MNKCASLIWNTKTIKCSRSLSTKGRQTPAEYCLDLVRKRDHESYLCSLLLPHNIRSAAFAIRAFNVEIAQIEDQVTDNLIGKMRYKFWEDSLDNIYSGLPPRSPVPLELHRLLKRHKLSKRYFKRLISSRSERSGVTTFADLESLEKYAENAFSSIYYLLLEANSTVNVDADHAASHLGKSHGIVTLIRSVPYHAQKRNCILPQDILMNHDISMESLFRGKSSKALTDVIFEVSSRAKLHLDKAQSLKGATQKECASIFLPAIIIEDYLEKLRLADFEIFSPRLHRKNNLLPLQLYWKNLVRKYK
ncbi:NADH dehydrogenase (ubiquinone) complex I, assembly factor 6 [Venturia canescens]|uniref:NADH dehydrogenase (ubiquinone) complex I, assembly factor 6 n=1 Tax=Venturia canescens TaxID=32260 RepID=UPI001C9CA201|nr:NADH dehydrogenase (ubiquinone) complex I, assembly factor 6 [Venturia canescens]